MTGYQASGAEAVSTASVVSGLASLGFLAAAFARWGRTRAAFASTWLLLSTLALASALQAVVLALKSGHTTALNARYELFSIPYLLVLMAAGMSVLGASKGASRVALIALLGILGAGWTVSLRSVWSDSPFFRPANEYPASASALATRARPGDVVVYPRWDAARLYNVYLPRDFPANQRVVPGNGDTVRLLREGATILELAAPLFFPRWMIEWPANRPPKRAAP
jgi:hypothetical protein